MLLNAPPRYGQGLLRVNNHFPDIRKMVYPAG